MGKIVCRSFQANATATMARAKSTIQRLHHIVMATFSLTNCWAIIMSPTRKRSPIP